MQRHGKSAWLCQYAQTQIDDFAARVDSYFSTVGGANNSVIWSSKPHLGCGTDIATWCTDSICTNENMLAKCVGAATKMQQYVTILSDANLTSPWILNYVPTFVCEHTDVQLSSASRRFVLF